MERYCPNCGTTMDTNIETGIDGTFLKLKCPKCYFVLSSSLCDLIFDLERRNADKINSTRSDDVKAPEHASGKPPLGCAPSYVYISARICELCEAIKRYSTETGKHNQIALWCKEIMYLNEMDRNLRYEEKSKVWKEDKDGKLQEMP